MDMEKGLSNKTEYIYADYFRLICAIGIVALHLDPFYDINEYVNFFVGSVLTRLCVPFFFLLSGFFLKDKLLDWKRVKKYVGHLLKLYLVYTIFYLPVIYGEYKDNGTPLWENIFSFFKKLIFVGSYGQLWYFLALIFAVLFLYLMMTQFGLGKKPMMIITIILFLVGLFFRVYDKPIRETVDAIRVVELYDNVFKTTRNGLFFGTPFVYWGNLIWKNKISIDRKKSFIYFWISLVALTIEAVFVRRVIGARQLDMLILLPMTSVFLVIIVLSKETDSLKQRFGMWCRKMSVYIFGFHLLLFQIIGWIAERKQMDINSMSMFCLTIVLNFILGGILIVLSENRYFQWIKKTFL